MKAICVRPRFNRLLLLAGFCSLALSAAVTAKAQQTITLLDLSTSAWHYNDSGSDLGTAWREASYPAESAWNTGYGLFGKDPTIPFPYPFPMQTPLILGAGRLTYYFRAHFSLTNDPATVIVTGSAYVDDGAVFYVNGVEVGRVRLTNNPVSFSNRAQLALPEGVATSFSVPSGLLVAGDNVLAVEVHQNAVTGSDVAFGANLQAATAVPPMILAEPSDQTLLQGESTLLTVVGAGNPAPAYRWYHNGMLDSSSSGPALALNDVGPGHAGGYFVVLSNSFGTATSRTAQITVILDTNAPAVLYALGLEDPTKVILRFTEALDDSQLAVTDPFGWDVIATDGSPPPNNTIAFVDFIDGTNVILNMHPANPRDPAKSYQVRFNNNQTDRFGNTIPAETLFPVATITNVAVTLGQNWRYNRTGDDPGAAWRTNDFVDDAWLLGPGPFDAYREFDTSPPEHCRMPAILPDTGETIGTCLMTLSNANNTAQYPAVYFRTHFNFTGDPRYSVLYLQTLVDDGAVIHLNGVELSRLGMPDGPISHATLAARTTFNAQHEMLEVSGASLRQGDNVIAVQVHQDSLASPDLTLGLRVIVMVP